jgi:general nucleoside transport system permease protein
MATVREPLTGDSHGPAGPSVRSDVRSRLLARRGMIGVGISLLALVIVRQVTGVTELTSGNTFGAAVTTAVPILFAGLGGLWAERVGVVNIGLEGMMILGTWFGAWAGWKYGAYWGVLVGTLGGAAGGLLHAVATVTFGVDQVVSGVAINILAAGLARFLSVVVYANVGVAGATQSPHVPGTVFHLTVPFLAGGPFVGVHRTSDFFGWLEARHIFVISDVSGLAKGLTSHLSGLTILAILLIPFSAWWFWRTRVGLRMRSVGENPIAAESLGIRVYGMKYLGVVVSGALAGLGGVFLVLEAAGIYREGQTAGRGYIGLASLIFGNWRPGGVAAAAGLFGYADALRLRSDAAIHGLLLFAAIGLIAAAFLAALRRKPTAVAAMVILSAGFFAWWAASSSVPQQLVSTVPYITTLVVLSVASQRLRPPAWDGRPFRRGQSQ